MYQEAGGELLNCLIGSESSTVFQQRLLNKSSIYLLIFAMCGGMEGELRKYI